MAASRHSIPYLGDTQLRELGLEQTAIADAVEDALIREVQGQIWTSPKASLYSGDGRYLMTTLSASDIPPVSVVKFVQVSPENPARDLPSINGSILLHDSRTGALLTVLDANWITEVRTAALSLVVARRLANPAATRIAFVGAGAQARSHLDMFHAHFPLSHVDIVGRGQSNKDRLAGLARGKGLTVTFHDDPRTAVTGADLVVTSVPVTSGVAPFLDAAWVGPGAFAAITDTGTPWRAQTFSRFGRILVDDIAQEAASERKLAPPELVAGDLRALIRDTGPSGPDQDKSTAFIFRGIAIGDFAVSALVWRMLEET